MYIYTYFIIVKILPEFLNRSDVMKLIRIVLNSALIVI